MPSPLDPLGDLASVVSDPLQAVTALAGLALAFGAALGYASARLRAERDPVVERIDAALPQTQCGQCGYPGCRPYAEAIAHRDEAINKCPPGGEETVRMLADLLGHEPEPLDGEPPTRRVAFIDEAACIGCTKCIQACPVDAIVGAARQMHTVLAEECTGCDLCVDPCPVDCIDMIPVPASPANWRWELPRGGWIASERTPA